MTRARSSSKRFSRWDKCFLFMRTSVRLRSDGRRVLVPPHTQHGSPAVDFQLLLEIRPHGPGTELQAACERFLLDEGDVGTEPVERGPFTIDPEVDPGGVLVARLFPQALHPVDNLAREPFALERVVERRIEGYDVRTVGLHDPIAGDVPL